MSLATPEDVILDLLHMQIVNDYTTSKDKVPLVHWAGLDLIRSKLKLQIWG